MRDPWKVLALVLALALGLVILLHEPSRAGDDGSTALMETQQVIAASAPSPIQPPSPERQTASPGMEPIGVLALLVRAQNAAGEPVSCFMTLRQEDVAAQGIYAPGGAAGFVDLQPRAFELRIRAEGYLESIERLLLPPSPLEQEHLVILEPSARIAVRFVTPDGRRLSEAIQERWPTHGLSNAMPYLYATSGDGPPQLPLSTFDFFSSAEARWRSAQGFYSSPDDVDGWLSLNVRPPLMLYVMLRNQLLSSLALESNVDQLSCIVDLAQIEALLGSVSLRLIGPDGQPRSDLLVNLLMGSRSPILRCTDGSGIYGLDGLPPGSFGILASTRDGLTMQRSVLLQPGEHLDLGDVRMEPAYQHRGKVIDNGGMAVAGAKAFLWNPVEPLIANRTVSNLTSDAEGGIAWTATAGARQLAILAPAGSGLGAGIWQVNSESSEFEFRLQSGIPVRFLSTEEDYQLRFFWLLVNGVAPAGGWALSRLPTSVSLAPGEHAWLITGPAGDVQGRGSFTVSEESPMHTVEVRLP